MFYAKHREQQDQHALIGKIDKLLDLPTLNSQEIDEFEKLLIKLDTYNGVAAADRREKLVDYLLGINQSEPLHGMSKAELIYLANSIEFLSSKDPVWATRFSHSARFDRFRVRTAPYTETASLYYFLRPDPDRIANLQIVVRIEEKLAGSASIGAKPELLKAYLARESPSDIDDATELARGLLDRPDLPYAWRMAILRDYVWIAIRSDSATKPKLVQEVSDRIDATLSEGRRSNPEFLALLVEKARLQAACDLYQEAHETLAKYFELSEQKKLEVNFAAERAPHLRRDDGPEENLPALFYIDAYLLRGLLIEHSLAMEPTKARKPSELLEARKVWAEGFEKVRRGRIGAYYEAAILGSLGDTINESDAENMVTNTLRGPSAQGSGQSFLVVLGAHKPYLSVIAQILRQTWASMRGRSYFRKIVLRQISYGEFAQIQTRLWAFEALRIACEDKDCVGGELTATQNIMLWELTGHVFKAFTEQTLTVDQILQFLLYFVVYDKEGLTNNWLLKQFMTRRGLGQGVLIDWKSISQHLLPDNEISLHLAYVVSRHLRLNVRSPNEAKAIIDMIKPHARPGSSIRYLIDLEP